MAMRRPRNEGEAEMFAEIRGEALKEVAERITRRIREGTLPLIMGTQFRNEVEAME